MCRSMADIQSTAAEIRRGKKEEDRRRRRRRKKLQGKNIMAPLLHRVAIINSVKLTICRSAPDPLLYVLARVDEHASEYHGT